MNFGAQGRAAAAAFASRLPAIGRLRIAYLGLLALFAWYALSMPAQLAAAHPELADPLSLDRWILIGLLLALAALVSRVGHAVPAWVSAVGGGVVGAVFFFQLFGWTWLDPTRFEWLLTSEDWAQHHLGWAMFRQEPWQWPPGRIGGLFHPVGSSVFYTDSMPLLALLLKPWSSLLPERFQYQGLLLLVNWTLQGATAALVLRLATREPLLQWLAAALCLLVPVLVLRIPHDTLTSHWLLLAAIGLWLRRAQEHGAPTPSLPAWLALTVVAALTHFYLLAMVLAIAITGWAKAVLADRVITYRRAAMALALMFGAVAAALWLAGAFELSLGASFDHDNAGRWSANLLTFVEPLWTSRLIAGGAFASSEQWEGWAYLGAGAWLTIVAAAVLFTTRRSMPNVLRGTAWLWLLSGVLFLFALGPVLTSGERTLLTLDWLRSLPLYSIFRSCGRFVWVLHYLLLLVALLVVARSRLRIAVPVLVAAVLLQAFELKNVRLYAVEQKVKAMVAQVERLQDPHWPTLAAGRRQLVLVPGKHCGPDVVEWLPIVDLAVRLRMSVNSGYVARLNARPWYAYCERQRSETPAQRAEADDALYIVHPDHVREFSTSDFRCEHIDALTACVATTDASP